MIDNLKLSSLLKDKGVVAANDLQLWLSEAQKMNLALVNYLYLTRPIETQQLLQILGGYYRLPVKVFEPQEKIPREILELMPEESAKNYQLIVFDRNVEGVFVGVVDPELPRLKETLDFFGKRVNAKIKQFLISPADFYRALSQYHSFDEEVAKAVDAFRRLKPSPQAKRAGAINMEFVEAGGEDAPIIKLVSTIIREAVIRLASDIHFEPLADAFRVRFRVEGSLATIGELPKELGGVITTRIKVMAQLKLDETRVPQDGRIQVFVEGREIDLRVATLPTPNGEAVAVRILDPLTGLKKLSDLGLAVYHEALLSKTIARPYGLVVVAGPTGSGKTTTQYAILQRLNQETKNIITLEDPIEYRLRGVNQSQVKPEIGYSFATGLRQILRQDPNVILVGEVRDEETAELVIHAALTGHLVFTTLHANDAISVIPRLLDLKVRRFLIPATLALMLSQRLIKRLCQDCHLKEPAPAALEQEIEAALQGVPSDILTPFNFQKPYVVYRPKGCEKCGQSGFKGRLGIFEAVIMTSEIARAVAEERSSEELRKIAERQGMVSLRQDGIIKALQGLATVEEVLKETV